MKESKHIEIIARGVCVKRGKILLCHTKGAPNTYLPGGHVEFNEGARQSLAREIREELGVAAGVGRFLGVVENTYIRSGERSCEINLVFEMSIRRMDPDRAPVSMEDQIEFRWVSMRSLRGQVLQPAILISKLPGWLKLEARSNRWSSTYRGEG